MVSLIMLIFVCITVDKVVLKDLLSQVHMTLKTVK